jgi:hypothetical protein
MRTAARPEGAGIPLGIDQVHQGAAARESGCGIASECVYEVRGRQWQHYYALEPYRPDNLSEHDELKQYYEGNSSA